MVDDPLIVVAALARIFDDLKVAYVVGGSLASSLYGIPRASNDADLMADLHARDVEPLAKALADDFYAPRELLDEAVRDRSSFNVIHLPTMFKADIFLPKNRAWSREEIARARQESVQVADSSYSIRFAGPEDTILQKLIWYRLGGEVSERQWNDVEGILKVQAGALDFEYLERWAHSLNVADLLQRLRKS